MTVVSVLSSSVVFVVCFWRFRMCPSVDDVRRVPVALLPRVAPLHSIHEWETVLYDVAILSHFFMMQQ